MLVFGNDNNMRGCHVAFRFDTSGGRGAKLQLPDGNELPSGFTDPIVVIGFSYSQSELMHYVKTFGRTYSYAFGHDPMQSVLQITYAGFLYGRAGTAGGGNATAAQLDLGMVVRGVNNTYRKNRAVANEKLAKFAIGNSKPLEGPIIGMSSNTMDPQTQLQQFSISIQLLEAQ